MSKLMNETTGNIDFITVFDGKLVQRVPEGTEGAIPRELQKGDNAGKTVYEKTYTSVQGKITGGGIEVKEFGAKKVKEIHVKIDNDLLLQLPMTLLSPFAQVLGGIDRSKEVKFAVYKNKRGKTGLNVSQDGTELKWEHTKEHPNGLPSPTYNDALDKWNFDEHDAFLINKVNEFFAGGAEQTLEDAGFSPSDNYTDADAPSEEEDEIPF